jgi:hypothetical protein
MDRIEVGTSMALAPFAPVVNGGYTVTHADLPPVPTNSLAACVDAARWHTLLHPPRSCVG